MGGRGEGGGFEGGPAPGRLQGQGQAEARTQRDSASATTLCPIFFGAMPGGHPPPPVGGRGLPVSGLGGGSGYLRFAQNPPLGSTSPPPTLGTPLGRLPRPFLQDRGAFDLPVWFHHFRTPPKLPPPKLITPIFWCHLHLTQACGPVGPSAPIFFINIRHLWCLSCSVG